MWGINITDEFENWFSEEIDNATRIDIRAIIKLLAEIGPTLGRPHADTVKDSKFRNMKELRIQSKRQVIRVFFIFDPKRNAVLLIGGNKRGKKRFYKEYIEKADMIYKNYLLAIKLEKHNAKSSKEKNSKEKNRPKRFF